MLEKKYISSAAIKLCILGQLKFKEQVEHTAIMSSAGPAKAHV
jgi:hypothetical protein